MQAVQDQTVTMTTTYRNAGGLPVDVTAPAFEIFNADGVSVFGPVVPEWQGLGSYSAEWEATEGIGWYRAVWTGTYLGGPVSPGEEWFEVVLPGMAVTFDDVAFLRMMAGDRIPTNKTEADAFFSNHDLQLILNEGGGDINSAASIAWRAKAAHYAELIDIDESGSSRALSQKFHQAQEMADNFAERAENVLEAFRSGWRVVGRVVCLDQSNDSLVEGTPFSGYSEHVRVYPLKRFASVLSGNWTGS
jgi:hypothetical protein